MGVRGLELDKLREDIHMIAVGKADECIQEEISRHEELSGLSRGGFCGTNKRKIVDQPKNRPSAKPRKSLLNKKETNQRKVRDQPEMKPGKRTKQSSFQKKETNKRKERDQPVVRTSKRTKKTSGIDVCTPVLKEGRRNCRKPPLDPLQTPSRPPLDCYAPPPAGRRTLGRSRVRCAASPPAQHGPPWPPPPPRRLSLSVRGPAPCTSAPRPRASPPAW
eukprot:1184118-Prorocentrum_minimum.AAC.1